MHMFLYRQNKNTPIKQSSPFTRRNKLIAYISVSISLLASANFAYAEKKCPVWTAEDAPIMEHTGRYRLVGKWQPDKSKQVYVQKKGTRLAETAYRWNRGVWFHMPLGYFSSFPRRSKTGKIRGTIDIAHEYIDKAEKVKWLNG